MGPREQERNSPNLGPIVLATPVLLCYKDSARCHFVRYTLHCILKFEEGSCHDGGGDAAGLDDDGRRGPLRGDRWWRARRDTVDDRDHRDGRGRRLPGPIPEQ